ncbi:adenylate/guanylate cyclase domain-containing protein [Gammaproteobacteria bacterium]|nr:adenylate/guanylate cyclase domain-containing protein [Gammaproteobacteria bacterium]
MNSGRISRRLTIILHADVVGSTMLVQRNETLAHERIQAAFHLFSETIETYGGITRELRGDALVAEFERASDAVAAALAFQVMNGEINTTLDDDIQPQLRIGVSLGEVIVADNTITGAGVVLAQRLEQLADSGGVVVQGSVSETVPVRMPFVFENMGEQALKGFDQPVRAFTARLRPGEELPAPEAKATPRAAELKDPQVPEKPSIAVLPFENMSGDPEQEFFADGMTEDIITALSSFRSLFVIARNSSFVYKGVAQDIKQIGAELGVRYVLEGSVRKSATRLRITAQLIEAASGAHLWAQRYDRVLEDVFELQDEITQTIVAAIQPELETAERERARRKSPENLDLWENFQRGMWYSYKWNSEDSTRAEKYFQEILTKSPQYAPAMAGLAWVAFQRIIFNYTTNKPITRQDLLDHGLKEASAAVRADDKDAFAQFVFGRLLALNGKFDESIERLNIAIEINPNYALAYHGLGYALAAGGNPADAVAQFDTALRLSPKDPYRRAFYTMKAFSLLLIKDYDGAVEWGRRGIRNRENVFWAYAHVLSALGHMERFDEAKQVLADLLQAKPDFCSATIDDCIRFRNATDREHYLEGLRKTGLSE